MKRIIILALVALIIATITAYGSTASESTTHPYTRYSHSKNWCMYYTGDSMCWVPHEYCNEDRSERNIQAGELGECPSPLPNSIPEIIVEQDKITVKETETVLLQPTCRDFDGDEILITYSGWMKKQTRVTNYEDAGTHKVTITCTDTNENEASVEVEIIVLNVNRAPVFMEWGK